MSLTRIAKSVSISPTPPHPVAGLHDLIVPPPAVGLETKLAVFDPAIPPNPPLWMPILPHPSDHHLFVIQGQGNIQETGPGGDGPNALEINIQAGDAVYLEKGKYHRIKNSGADKLVILSAKTI